MNKKAVKYLVFPTIIIVISLMAYFAYRPKVSSPPNRTFSSYTLLTSAWEKYKIQFINSDGRVIDYSQGDITTSEGQSYAMLQSVWVDDKPTFDKVWNWTKDNLQLEDNHLFGWRWGKNSDNSYGFITDGGSNPASDADSDIALALILAARRWNDSSYYQAAIPILADLWGQETTTVGENRYLLAGPWAKNDEEIIINPSYFAPYAWRIFAVSDPDRDWNSLIKPSYQLLNQITSNPIDQTTSSNLPPDWIAINPKTGNILKPSQSKLTTNYSFDAIRIPWRVALDYQWNHEPLAKQYLVKHFTVLATHYQTRGKIYASYAQNGSPLTNTENPAVYATSLAYLTIANPNLAEKLYQEKILTYYINDTNSLNPQLSYYDQNWLWFSMALYHQFITDFSAVPTK